MSTGRPRLIKHFQGRLRTLLPVRSVSWQAKCGRNVNHNRGIMVESSQGSLPVSSVSSPCLRGLDKRQGTWTVTSEINHNQMEESRPSTSSPWCFLLTIYSSVARTRKAGQLERAVCVVSSIYCPLNSFTTFFASPRTSSAILAVDCTWPVKCRESIPPSNNVAIRSQFVPGGETESEKENSWPKGENKV